MSLEFKFEYTDDDGNEVEYVLPGKYEVCSNCEGHGTHLREGMRNHAYTSEEFDEEFDDEDRAEYFTHGGMRINAIKLVREFTGLGLKDSKDLAENIGVIMKGYKE
jgi:hypothetical protein